MYIHDCKISSDGYRLKTHVGCRTLQAGRHQGRLKKASPCSALYYTARSIPIQARRRTQILRCTDIASTYRPTSRLVTINAIDLWCCQSRWRHIYGACKYWLFALNPGSPNHYHHRVWGSDKWWCAVRGTLTLFLSWTCPTQSYWT